MASQMRYPRPDEPGRLIMFYVSEDNAYGMTHYLNQNGWYNGSYVEWTEKNGPKGSNEYNPRDGINVSPLIRFCLVLHDLQRTCFKSNCVDRSVSMSSIFKPLKIVDVRVWQKP